MRLCRTLMRTAASRRHRFVVLLVLLTLAGPADITRQARAQGCSLCRDNVSQTNPAIQKSYRSAILLMIAGAVGICSATAVVLRKLR